jgi:hypothetical protein
MYGLNEIVAMNTTANLSHKKRVSSDHLLRYSICFNAWPGDYNIPNPITHGEWESRQQKGSEHESASNE